MRRSAQCSPFLSLEPRVDCIRFGITDFEFREGLVFGFENEDSLLGDDRRRHGQDAGPQSVKPVTADCPRALRVRRTPPVVSMPGFRTRGSLETTSIFWISNKKKRKLPILFWIRRVGWCSQRSREPVPSQSNNFLAHRDSRFGGAKQSLSSAVPVFVHPGDHWVEKGRGCFRARADVNVPGGDAEPHKCQVRSSVVLGFSEGWRKLLRN